jgi:hypothetical protein
MSTYNRRDFLKLLAAVPAAYTLSRLLPESVFRYSVSSPSVPNVILLLFDAISGKQRQTWNDLQDGQMVITRIIRRQISRPRE